MAESDWLKEVFERANRELAELPEWARPVWCPPVDENEKSVIVSPELARFLLDCIQFCRDHYVIDPGERAHQLTYEAAMKLAPIANQNVSK